MIEAIKQVREHTNLGLKKTKEAVERYRNGDRSPLASVAAAMKSAGASDDFDEEFAQPFQVSMDDGVGCALKQQI